MYEEFVVVYNKQPKEKKLEVQIITLSSHSPTIVLFVLINLFY